jgi:putative flippase GtrA
VRSPASTLGVRLTRYTSASVVAFVTSEAVLVVCYAGGLLGTTGATLAAFVAGAVPNYLLNRRWVWGRRGPVRVGREVVLYAAVSLVTLLAASFATAWAAGAIDGSTEMRTAGVAAAYLVVYGTLFVLKFVVFERVVFAEGA